VRIESKTVRLIISKRSAGASASNLFIPDPSPPS
jgi:hypothetical protein